MTEEKRLEEILTTIGSIRKEGEVAEVRILKTKQGTISGYFDNYRELVKSIEAYIGQHDIYFTLNPVNKDLLARCKNRLGGYAKHTSSDRDIEKISYILIDLDPIRASGISSTAEEKEEAKKLVGRIEEDLVSDGFPEPIVADSGNGYHLLLPVDLENSEENVARIKEFLQALDFLYTTDKVEVDTTTYNPSRIVKLYGTLATKGEDTEERPHRWSKLLKLPTKMQVVEKDMIEQVIDKRPKEEIIEKNSNASNNKKIDMESFIEKHKLDLRHKKPYGKAATVYVLRTCPWDSDHTDNAAYIIQYDSGAIVAGCHHNGCSDENWASLKELLGEESLGNPREAESNKELKQSDVLVELAKDFDYFTDELEEPYVAVDINGHKEVMKVTSKRFQLYLTKLYFDKTSKAVSSDTINKSTNTLRMLAAYSENVRKLQKRIALDDRSYYYDLCDEKWRSVKIDEDGISIEDRPPILFTRSRNMKEQMEPDFSAEPKDLIELVKKHFRFKKESDTVLFTTYLVSCFLPQIAHVILVLFGEKGSAKSTTMRMIKRIVDPAMQDVLSMPTSIQDLAIVLSNNYMPCFDNLDTLSASKSDMLCMAATGGAFSKRKLYSDSDETILQFKRCVVLNGINIVATRADLLDRSIVLELERIKKTERKTERKIWQSFEEDLPKFLGAIFNTISKAIPLYDQVELTEVGRMADFTYWGYAIAEVLQIGGDSFLEAYLSNQDTANEEALSSHPVAAAVIALMKSNNKWASSVSALLKELEGVAERERINTRVKTWPKDANVLSKRLKEVKSNLEEIGIYYDIRHAGDYKKVTIEKEKEKVEEVS